MSDDFVDIDPVPCLDWIAQIRSAVAPFENALPLVPDVGDAGASETIANLMALAGNVPPSISAQVGLCADSMVLCAIDAIEADTPPISFLLVELQESAAPDHSELFVPPASTTLPPAGPLSALLVDQASVSSNGGLAGSQPESDPNAGAGLQWDGDEWVYPTSEGNP